MSFQARRGVARRGLKQRSRFSKVPTFVIVLGVLPLALAGLRLEEEAADGDGEGRRGRPDKFLGKVEIGVLLLDLVI
jgi:hypothetical protein